MKIPPRLKTAILMLALAGPLAAEKDTLCPNPMPVDPSGAPRVIRLDSNLEVDSVVGVCVLNLDKWSQQPGNDPYKLIPYVDGLGLRGNYPVEVHPTKDLVYFHLNIKPQSKENWTNILGSPRSLTKEVTFSVGTEAGSAFDTAAFGKSAAVLVVIDRYYGLIAVIFVVVVVIGFLRLATTTNILREELTGPCDGTLRPYNLGRTQMAFWFLLICMSYIVIWLVTDTLDTITPSLLGLMGISATTALGEAMIDTNSTMSSALTRTTLQSQLGAVTQTIQDLQNDPNPDPVRLEAARTRQLQLTQQRDALPPRPMVEASKGFMRDILSDGVDYSLHRFQIAVWTVVLGMMFLSSVYNDFAMPEFSATLLGLMGISSGTYLGFKFPEKQ